jgi:hypothetical protein
LSRIARIGERGGLHIMQESAESVKPDLRSRVKR